MLTQGRRSLQYFCFLENETIAARCTTVKYSFHSNIETLLEITESTLVFERTSNDY